MVGTEEYPSISETIFGFTLQKWSSLARVPEDMETDRWQPDTLEQRIKGAIFGVGSGLYVLVALRYRSRLPELIEMLGILNRRKRRSFRKGQKRQSS